MRAIIKWMNELYFTVVVLNLNKFLSIDFNKQTLHKKWSFPLRISSVNVIKSAVSWGFGHIYWINPRWKTSFFVQWKISSTCARQMLCLDYSNLQDRRNLSKLYLIARGHWFHVQLNPGFSNSQGTDKVVRKIRYSKNRSTV